MADTKTVSGRVHDRGDFLVIEDADKTSTWHLPVKVKGKADHRLMGAAWAALFSAGGFRGNKYAGPQAATAKRKLRALYKSEGLDEPTEESLELDEAYLGEYYGEYGETPYYLRPEYVPWGATSFADVRAAHAAQEYAHQLEILTEQYIKLIENVMGSYERSLDDKISGVQAVTAEFAALLRGVQPVAEGDALAGVAGTVEGEPAIQEVAESVMGHATTLREAAEGSDDVLYLDVELIQPGWGNPRDNHYYPAETLRKAAPLFAGVKMFETDHDAKARSNRTWASTIVGVKGFSESGAPIAQVAVHDPEFARKARNLHKLGLLEKLECSLLGKGMARPYREGERTGSLIQELTQVATVEWVSRAGAGGHATGIAESDKGEAGMNEKDKDKGKGPEGGDAALSEGVVETDVREGAEGAPQTDAGATATPDAAASAAAAQEPAASAAPVGEAQPVTPVVLAEAEVEAALAEAKAPEIVRKWLRTRPFVDAAAVRAAVREMVADLVEATGSGKPWGLGEAQPQAQPALTAEKYTEAMNGVMAKYGLPTIPVQG